MVIRFIDDAIISALSGGTSSLSPYLNVGDTTEIPFCQVVFLGAGAYLFAHFDFKLTQMRVGQHSFQLPGLDLRALRLPCLALESVTVFECDYEEVNKIRLLQKLFCHSHCVSHLRFWNSNAASYVLFLHLPVLIPPQ